MNRRRANMQASICEKRSASNMESISLVLGILALFCGLGLPYGKAGRGVPTKHSLLTLGCLILLAVQ